MYFCLCDNVVINNASAYAHAHGTGFRAVAYNGGYIGIVFSCDVDSFSSSKSNIIIHLHVCAGIAAHIGNHTRNACAAGSCTANDNANISNIICCAKIDIIRNNLHAISNIYFRIVIGILYTYRTTNNVRNIACILLIGKPTKLANAKDIPFSNICIDIYIFTSFKLSGTAKINCRIIMQVLYADITGNSSSEFLRA